MGNLWKTDLEPHAIISAIDGRYVPTEAFAQKPALIWAETGSGKTTAAIRFAKEQVEYDLVVVTLPVVAQVQQIESEGDPAIHCAYGNRAPTCAGKRIVVCTYDKARSLVLSGAAKSALLICDEVHKLRAAATYRDAAIELERSIPSEWAHVIGLSGTPQVCAEYFCTNILRVETAAQRYCYKAFELKTESDGVAQLIALAQIESQDWAVPAFIYLPNNTVLAKIEAALQTLNPNIRIVTITADRAKRDPALVQRVCGTRDEPANWDVCLGTNYVEEGLSVYHARETNLFIYTPGRTKTDPTAIKQFAARVRTNFRTNVFHLLKHNDQKVTFSHDDERVAELTAETNALIAKQSREMNQRSGRSTSAGKLRRETQFKGEACPEKIQQKVIAERWQHHEDRYSYAEKLKAAFGHSDAWFQEADTYVGETKQLKRQLEEQSAIEGDFASKPLLEILSGIHEHVQTELFRAIIMNRILNSAIFRDLVDLRNLNAPDELSPWHEDPLASEQDRLETIREWAAHPDTWELLRDWQWNELAELGHETRGEGLRLAIQSWFARGGTPRDRYRQLAQNLVRQNLNSQMMKEKLSQYSPREAAAVRVWITFNRTTKSYELQPVEHVARWEPFLPLFASQLTVKSALWKPTARLKPLLVGGKNAAAKYLTQKGLLQVSLSKLAFEACNQSSYSPLVWLNRETVLPIAERDASNPNSTPWILGGADAEGNPLSRSDVLFWLQGAEPTPGRNSDPTGEITGGGGELIPQFASGAFAEVKENWDAVACKTATDVADARTVGVVRADGVRTKPLRRFAYSPQKLGLVVLDLDIKSGKNGLTELNAIAERLGCEPIDVATHPCVVRTPSGGYHLVFRAPVGKTFQSNVVAPGIDVFHANKMLTAPGSQKCVDGELRDYVLFGKFSAAPELPSWIENLLDAETTSYEREERAEFIVREPREQVSAETICDRTTAKRCGYSGRNEACFILAFVLAKAGFNEQEIRDCLQTRPETSGHDRMRYTIRYAIRRANRA